MKTKELLCWLYETSIKMVDAIDKLSIVHNMIDTQEYLNWKDDLNALSIDPDRHTI